MYDSFSSDYDRFVNWQDRLAFEMPFLESQLGTLATSADQPIRVLDAATGTGMHVIELARRGFVASGADYSTGMIDKARQNAMDAGVKVVFEVAGFGELAQAFSIKPGFDALLCLGNSLPHLLSLTELERTLGDFADCLRPGGKLILQNRNFDAVLVKRERWMEPQSYRESDQEWIFLRMYDFEPSGLINFHVIKLHQQAGKSWTQKVNSTQLYPLRKAELVEALQKTGFHTLQLYGGLNGAEFDRETSGNLVITAIHK
jgi:glycine/sarcosine N-methyltransferase